MYQSDADKTEEASWEIGTKTTSYFGKYKMRITEKYSVLLVAKALSPPSSAKSSTIESQSLKNTA